MMKKNGSFADKDLLLEPFRYTIRKRYENFVLREVGFTEGKRGWQMFLTPIFIMDFIKPIRLGYFGSGLRLLRPCI